MPRWIVAVALACSCVRASAGEGAPPGQTAELATGTPTVETARVPEGGIQPQAVVGEDGTIHLLYFKGDAAAGDLFYVKRGRSETVWSKPLRVNSQASSAVAVGNDRGGHLALGRGGAVHVAWNGSGKAAPKDPQGHSSMLYARLPVGKGSFEAQRGLMTVSTTLDGGGSVAADAGGNVYVVWHGLPVDAKDKSETGRRVFVAASADDGATFATETAVSDSGSGACGCCGLRAAALADGTALVLYRAAGAGVNRDMHLMRSADKGKSFTDTRLDEWRADTCPMSTASIAPMAKGAVLAWENKREVRWGVLKDGDAAPAAAPKVGERADVCRYPSVAADAEGRVVVAWTQGMGWNTGGRLRWQLFDAEGKPMARYEAESGVADAVPEWSLVAAVAKPGGGFLILH